MHVYIWWARGLSCCSAVCMVEQQLRWWGEKYQVWFFSQRLSYTLSNLDNIRLNWEVNEIIIIKKITIFSLILCMLVLIGYCNITSRQVKPHCTHTQKTNTLLYFITSPVVSRPRPFILSFLLCFCLCIRFFLSSVAALTASLLFVHTFIFLSPQLPGKKLCWTAAIFVLN